MPRFSILFKSEFQLSERANEQASELEIRESTAKTHQTMVLKMVEFSARGNANCVNEKMCLDKIAKCQRLEKVFCDGISCSKQNNRKFLNTEK